MTWAPFVKGANRKKEELAPFVKGADVSSGGFWGS